MTNEEFREYWKQNSEAILLEKGLLNG